MDTIIVAEIGINHNAELNTAKALVNAAADAGADYVKFQKRDPSMICEAHRELDRVRMTPWGKMTHLQYRQRFEFDRREYDEIALHCEKVGIGWFASVWDMMSLTFIVDYVPPYIKIPSALLTDHMLIEAAVKTGRPLVLSTGMSTLDEIRAAARIVRKAETGRYEKHMLHCHSSYPAPTYELNLRVIPELQAQFSEWHIGYSGHEMELEPTVAAVVLGAEMVERHITLDRSMWGSDQQASVAPTGFRQLVKRIRSIEKALGDGMKRCWDSEKLAMEKLRPPHLRG